MLDGTWCDQHIPRLIDRLMNGLLKINPDKRAIFHCLLLNIFNSQIYISIEN